MSKNKNVRNLIMNILPDNRPITSLQIVEDYEKCPKNFVSINRTHDQDSDADLWRETNILFGKRTGRYLCLSKSEGLPDYIVEKLSVISERDQPPEGFSLLSRTADSEQKAWRKRQIAYKLTKRTSVTQAVTDIILCSKLKMAPEGFLLAGDINGIAICYKLGPLAHRPPPQPPAGAAPPPPVPSKRDSYNGFENSLHYLNITAKPPFPLPPNDGLPIRLQSATSTHKQSYTPSCGTMGGAHIDIEGIPFQLNVNLTKDTFKMPPLHIQSASDKLDYDFHLERQILCTTKSSNRNLKNPFFH